MHKGYKNYFEEYDKHFPRIKYFLKPQNLTLVNKCNIIMTDKIFNRKCSYSQTSVFLTKKKCGYLEKYFRRKCFIFTGLWKHA